MTQAVAANPQYESDFRELKTRRDSEPAWLRELLDTGASAEAGSLSSGVAEALAALRSAAS